MMILKIHDLIPVLEGRKRTISGHPRANTRLAKRSFLTSVAIVIVLPLFLALTSCAPDSYTETLWSQRSPSGNYRAALMRAVTNAGIAADAETVTLRVTKLGTAGWFYKDKLEYDSLNLDYGCPEPTACWTGPNKLTVNVVTRQTAGCLERRKGDLTVVRNYRRFENHSSRGWGKNL